MRAYQPRGKSSVNPDLFVCMSLMGDRLPVAVCLIVTRATIKVHPIFLRFFFFQEIKTCPS